MAFEPPFLYRGTTVGWPGNKVLQQLELTPTSEDPLVAALFAVWASRYNAAIVQVCEFRSVAEWIGVSNWKSRIEREWVVTVPPVVFAEQFVVKAISVQMAREILAEMGYALAPSFVDQAEFRLRLETTARLDEREIMKFNELMLERG